MRILGASELAEDTRFRTFADRLENREALVETLKGLSREQTTATWLERLKGEVPCAPVNSVEEAFRDPLVAENDMILELPHPEFDVVRQVASPIKISDTETQHRRGPELGEHTVEILSDYLSLPKEEIEALRQAGVV